MKKNDVNEKAAAILVVDDSPVDLRLMAKILLSKGYRVRSCLDGSTALEEVQNERPDLILLDVKMPEIDGYDVCRKLKLNQDTEEIPIVFISAADELLNKVRGFEVGGVDYITKPFQAEDFLARVETHLNLHYMKGRLKTQNILLHREIRERKKVEQELKQHKEQLEIKIKVRTANLMQVNLQLKQEILERRKAESALRQSEERYRNIFETASVSLWETDVSLLMATIEALKSEGVTDFSRYMNSHPDFIDQASKMVRLRDVNTETLRLFGAKQKEALFDSLDKVFIPEATRVFQDALIVIAEGKNDFQAEAVFLTMQGKKIHVLLRLKIPYSNESQGSVIVSMMNITELKKVEHALREANEIINRSSSIVFLWKNKKGWPVELVSDNVETLFGYTSDEFMTAKVLYEQVIHPDDFARVDKEVGGSSSENEKVEFKHQPYRIISKDGTVNWVDDHTFFRRDTQGKITHFQGIVTNITDRKHAEIEKERLISELETKNAELERFTYTVSHELRAPLVTLKSFSSMLEKDLADGDSARTKQDLDFISSGASQMQQLLNDLLELSRIGQVVNQMESVELTPLVREVLDLLANQIYELRIQVIVDPQLPRVVGDRSRLSEVFQNLIENAIKFMDEQAEPKIEIGAKRTEGETVCYVKDNGVGIAPRYHEKVFGLFERLESSVEGTGVGLALVKRIVETHGGHVWVESGGYQRGSAFFFALPGS